LRLVYPEGIEGLERGMRNRTIYFISLYYKNPSFLMKGFGFIALILYPYNSFLVNIFTILIIARIISPKKTNMCSEFRSFCPRPLSVRISPTGAKMTEIATTIAVKNAT
jgi:hypothetical protein